VGYIRNYQITTCDRKFTEIENTIHELFRLDRNATFIGATVLLITCESLGRVTSNLKLCEITLYSIEWSKPKVHA